MRYLNPPPPRPPKPEYAPLVVDGKAYYSYDGPVVLFDREIARWKGGTRAVSQAKARTNLCFQARRDLELPQRSPIQLPGRIKVHGVKEDDQK